MSGQRKYLWRDGDWVEVDLAAPRLKSIAPMIVRDVEPYRSVITGERIGGRAQHREHLRMHGCIEIGNEVQSPHRAPLPPIAPAIAEAIQASPERHAEARAVSERAAKAL